jgi:hypothetical protein
MADAQDLDVVKREADGDDESAERGGAREETKAEKKARKRAEKARELAEDAHRPLDSWERYRALCDALKEANDLVDLADHKARFALVIMGALNAVMFIVAMAASPTTWTLSSRSVADSTLYAPLLNAASACARDVTWPSSFSVHSFARLLSSTARSPVTIAAAQSRSICLIACSSAPSAVVPGAGRSLL